MPDIDAVRAGVRHHHERWDGNGYLEGLEGEQIPLIARILAVGRCLLGHDHVAPVPQGTPVEEALKRLGDAAGSQLEERLVMAFVEGIETAPDAPLPGEERTPCGGRSYG